MDETTLNEAETRAADFRADVRANIRSIKSAAREPSLRELAAEMRRKHELVLPAAGLPRGRLFHRMTQEEMRRGDQAT
jgi:hypothetical protein